MKTKITLLHSSWIQSGIPAALVAFACGCATEQPVGRVSSEQTSLAAGVEVEPGAIAIIRAQDAPVVRIEVPEKWPLETRKERAGEMARTCLDPPNLRDASADALYSPVGVVLAPFAATYGALTPGTVQTGVQQGGKLESELTHAVASKAGQGRFCYLFTQAAGKNYHRPLLGLNSAKEAPLQSQPVAVIIETKIQELHLQPVKPASSSYALQIKAVATLRDPWTGRTLSEFPMQYRSGSAPFGAWTFPESFVGVVDTGYRKLAEYAAEQLLQGATTAPLLVGAGNKQPNQVPSRSNRLLVSYAGQSSAALVNVSSMQAQGSIGIYSSPERRFVSIQKPMSRDEAVSSAIQDVEWSLDGLQDSRNLVIQLGACAAALPVSLYKQTMAIVRGVNEKQLRSADESIRRISTQVKPQIELAQELALNLSQRTSQQVVFFDHALPPTAYAASNPGRAARFIPVAGQAPAANHLQTLIEVRVNNAALNGRDGLNPALSLCVEAEAILIRAQDGAELERRPIQYRSSAKRFEQWAANDAQAFRDELRVCFREMSQNLASQFMQAKTFKRNQVPDALLVRN